MASKDECEGKTASPVDLDLEPRTRLSKGQSEQNDEKAINVLQVAVGLPTATEGQDFHTRESMQLASSTLSPAVAIPADDAEKPKKKHDLTFFGPREKDDDHAEKNSPPATCENDPHCPQPTSLRRTNRTLPYSAAYQPGAVSVTPRSTNVLHPLQAIRTSSSRNSNSSVSSNSSSTTTNDPPDVLLNATLVIQDDSSHHSQGDNNVPVTHEIVEAKPLLEGFRAILANNRFKYVALAFLIVLLAVVIPLALKSRDSKWDSSQCGKRSLNQADYRGTTGQTEAGEVCQRWDSQEPHTHNYYSELFSEAGLEENYCRNPSGTDARPWCYTMNPLSRWGWCDIPFCDGKPYVEPQEECGTLSIRQEDYRGNISITATGKECQPWASMEPNFHDRTPERFPNAGLEANYCRNPDGSSTAWCFTMDNSTRLEPCDITPCGVRKTLRHHNKTCQENCTIYNCGTESLRQTDYRGFQNITASGRVCQRWDSQFPHKHGKTPTNLPNAGLEGNYCRNPDLTASLWCHTTDPNKWTDLCEVPYCPEEVIPRRTCGTFPTQKDYRGAISKTRSGLDCVAWATSAEAASLGFTPENMPDQGLFGAYCRNPGHERNQSWCYVDNPNSTSTWEFCDVPECKECGSPSMNKEDYRGLTSTTRSGKTCVSWVSRAKELVSLNLTMDYFVLEDNFCRNLMGYHDDVWCFVEGDSSSEWDYCDVPDCEEEKANELADPQVCGSVSNHQSDYRGTINVTVSGRACQPWASQSPHQHKHSPAAYPLDGLENNWCRNPDGPSSLGAWCYTQDPDVLWEYCLVPSCSVEVSNTTCGSLALKQQDYRGMLNVTLDGIPCQRWDSQYPHSHKYDPAISAIAGLEENFCRNPDGSERVWCFSTNPDVLWSYCEVPDCQ